MTSHTVSRYMTGPPVVLEATDSLRAVATATAERDIEAVLVRTDTTQIGGRA